MISVTRLRLVHPVLPREVRPDLPLSRPPVGHPSRLPLIMAMAKTASRVVGREASTYPAPCCHQSPLAILTVATSLRIELLTICLE
jgi:hypothetical protein